MSPKNTQITLLKVQRDLLNRNVSIISGRDFARFFSLAKQKAATLLKESVRNGLFTRVKKGIYILNANPPSAFELANILFTPSYVSLESALSFYRLIPETVYSISSITPKYPIGINAFNRQFIYSKIQKELFFGYAPISIGSSGKKILIAEKEKALLDFLYFIAIGKRKTNDRIMLLGLDEKKVRNHLPHFQKALKGRKLVTFNRLIKNLNLL